ncbi:MAG TPA: SDR family oxidoreductase, partial [Planctomycetaceae bacterium]|nr:SDR family oxidoreductase [Planctomycetaceae bacterium]
MSQWVVVTGAGRGLGRALTRRLVERGWSVIGCTRSAESLKSLQDEFNSPHHFAQVDVADDGQVAAWAHEHLREGRVPELLINNAAVINENAVLWEVPVEAFHRLMDVNVDGTFHVLRHWLPAMVERQRGVIVNFSSTWGRTTSPQVAPYCASKFAIEGLTQALAQELPRGMAAVALNPGVIDTDMLRTCFGAGAAMYP